MQSSDRPELLVAAPPCTLFSTLQNLSVWTEEKQREFAKAKLHNYELLYENI